MTKDNESSFRKGLSFLRKVLLQYAVFNVCLTDVTARWITLPILALSPWMIGLRIASYVTVCVYPIQNDPWV